MGECGGEGGVESMLEEYIMLLSCKRKKSRVRSRIFFILITDFLEDPVSVIICQIDEKIRTVHFFLS